MTTGGIVSALFSNATERGFHPYGTVEDLDMHLWKARVAESPDDLENVPAYRNHEARAHETEISRQNIEDDDCPYTKAQPSDSSQGSVIDSGRQIWKKCRHSSEQKDHPT